MPGTLFVLYTLSHFPQALNYHLKLLFWKRKWQPTPVFLPGESQGWKSLVGCRLCGGTESDTTEATWQQQRKQTTLPTLWKIFWKNTISYFKPPSNNIKLSRVTTLSMIFCTDFFLFFFWHLFIYLAVLGLSCDMPDLCCSVKTSLVVAHIDWVALY